MSFALALQHCIQIGKGQSLWHDVVIHVLSIYPIPPILSWLLLQGFDTYRPNNPILNCISNISGGSWISEADIWGLIYGVLMYSMYDATMSVFPHNHLSQHSPKTKKGVCGEEKVLNILSSLCCHLVPICICAVHITNTIKTRILLCFFSQ